jgi:hypothetical protein
LNRQGAKTTKEKQSRIIYAKTPGLIENALTILVVMTFTLMAFLGVLAVKLI